MSKQSDWNRCYDLWTSHMYYEAAESNYDYANAEKANREYIASCLEFKNNYGETFCPSRRAA